MVKYCFFCVAKLQIMYYKKKIKKMTIASDL